MSGPNLRRLLRAAEVAELLAVSIRTVWDYRARGALPAILLGPGTVRFAPEDVARFIQERSERALREAGKL